MVCTVSHWTGAHRKRVQLSVPDPDVRALCAAWSTLGVLIVGAWAGTAPGGVVAGLVMAGTRSAQLNQGLGQQPAWDPAGS